MVETKNYNGKGWIATNVASGRIKGIPQSEALRVIERFTRVAPDRITYEITLTDPSMWTQPWTAVVRLKQTDAKIYEDACHEGNAMVMEGILAGARVQDRLAGR